tara:strand:+ start:1134 stop:1385 length:252 start_codon:yes stop_codon:yes gene_type:complete
MAMTLPKPKCYACGKRASWSIMFCSKKCAANIALGLFEGTDDWFWCQDCKSWVNEDSDLDSHFDLNKSGKCYGKTISLSEYEG